MRVFVRLRPPGKGDGEPMVRTDAARRLIWLGAERDGGGAGGAAPADPVQFEVDRVLTPAEDQAAVYAEVAQPVVEAVSHGATGCIMCYGQTGAGKTYTLAGGGGGDEDGGGGIVERALRQLLPAGAGAANPNPNPNPDPSPSPNPNPNPSPNANPHPHPTPNQTAASSYYEGNFDDHVTTTEAMRREGEEDSGSEVAGPALP